MNIKNNVTRVPQSQKMVIIIFICHIIISPAYETIFPWFSPNILIVSNSSI